MYFRAVRNFFYVSNRYAQIWRWHCALVKKSNRLAVRLLWSWTFTAICDAEIRSALSSLSQLSASIFGRQHQTSGGATCQQTLSPKSGSTLHPSLFHFPNLLRQNNQPGFDSSYSNRRKFHTPACRPCRGPVGTLGLGESLALYSSHPSCHSLIPAFKLCCCIAWVSLE